MLHKTLMINDIVIEIIKRSIQTTILNVLMNKIVQKQFDSIMYFIKNNRNVNFKIQVAHSINDKTMLY